MYLGARNESEYQNALTILEDTGFNELGMREEFPDIDLYETCDPEEGAAQVLKQLLD